MDVGAARIARSARVRAISHRPSRVSVDSAATLRRDDLVCLRVPRPGLAVGRHGTGARRRIPGRRRRPRRRRRRARRIDQPALPSRARPTSSTGPRTPSRRCSPSSIAYLAAVRERGPRSGSTRPLAGLRRRPFDGPVLGPRRRRGDLARGRRPARPRARPADAGVRRGPRRGDGRDPRPRRRGPPRARRSGPRPTASSVSPIATPPARSSCRGERAAIEAAAEIAKELGARKAIVLPVSVAAHSPLMAEAADGMRAAIAAVEFGD